MVTVTPVPLVGTGAYGLLSVLAVHALWYESGFMAPWPLLAGTAAVVATSVFWLVLQLSWAGVAAALAVAVAAAGLGRHWSRAHGWAPVHAFTLAAGATLTCAWVGFGQIPGQGSAGTVNLVGHVLLAVAAVALLCIAARRVGTRSA
ncbi:hypothetical protein [Streptomyces sp. NPDC001661]